MTGKRASLFTKKKQPTTTKNRGNIEDLNHFIIFYKGISQKRKKKHARKQINNFFFFLFDIKLA
jgi:hypothetical protein